MYSDMCVYVAVPRQDTVLFVPIAKNYTYCWFIAHTQMVNVRTMSVSMYEYSRVEFFHYIDYCFLIYVHDVGRFKLRLFL